MDALAALAAARDVAGAAGAFLPLLVGRAGVRAGAVVQRDAGVGVVLASLGYGCDTMAPGSTLPLDSGLPVTEALRTGRRTVQGEGPGWLALPAGRRSPAAALLLSLDVRPPSDPADLGRLDRLAAALGAALDRASHPDRAEVELARVAAALAPGCPADPQLDVVVRCRPAHGCVGGDRMLALPDGRGGSWLVAADVCGSDLAAAIVAHGLQTAAAAVAGFAAGPRQMLDALEQALGPVVGPGSFVTACVVHLAPDAALRVATAGHPAPFLLNGFGARLLDVDPGQPLVLESGPAGVRTELATVLPPGAVVLLHSDGLVERRSPDGTVLLEAARLTTDLDLGDLEAAADELLAVADRLAPAMDDVSLLLARPRG